MTTNEERTKKKEGKDSTYSVFGYIWTQCYMTLLILEWATEKWSHDTLKQAYVYL